MIVAGRRTHEATNVRELTVFVIGVRINNWMRPDGWLPTFRAMPRMLAELSADPTSGLLGYQIFARPRGLYSVQYWNDPESIYRYASEPDAEHHPAWAAFNRRARKVPGAVGIFHETFPVRGAESMYVDMPEFGLGQAVGTVPVSGSGSLDRAAGRMARGRANSASQSDAEQGH